MDERTGSRSLPPWTLAVTAMASVQLGSALSVHMISRIGAGGTAWLRLSIGAIVFLALARPSLRTRSRSELRLVLGLGVTTGVQTIAFLNAIAHIPLGTSVAVEFLGPVSVAAWHSHNRRALTWPVLALAGVLLLTQPWQGRVDGLGLGSAAVAGVGWGTYIVLTQRVGDTFEGIDGLSLTTPVAALTAAAVGVPQAIGHLSVTLLAQAVGLALLLPVLPYACEMLALRRMKHSAFGTLMAVEPAIGALLGLIILNQHLSLAMVAGVLLVVTAGGAAQRDGQRSAGLLDSEAVQDAIVRAPVASDSHL